MSTQAVAVLFAFAVVAGTWAQPGIAQTGTHDREVLQRSQLRVGADERECARQCRPMYKECMINCDRSGKVPGVTSHSDDCAADCSTLVGQCIEECQKLSSGFPLLLRPCR